MTALRKDPLRPRPTRTAPPGLVVLLHAVGSRSETGASLADFSVRLVREALGDRPRIVIHADDAGAFEGMGKVVPTPASRSGSLVGRLSGYARIAAGLSGDKFEFKGGFPELDSAGPNLIVGAGGGFLRTGTRRESLGTMLAHLPQLLWAGNQPVPSVYLPQSIGPFATRIGRRLRDAVERIDHLYVRDDRTASLFRHHTGMRRAPDLALMERVDGLPVSARDTGHERIYLAVGPRPRDAKRLAVYRDRIAALRALLPDAEILLDGDGDTAKHESGPNLCESLGWNGPFRTVSQALARGPSGVLVSVSLETCLRGMMSGWPAVHLAVDRKGFGAFADLGVEHCVRKATCFDPQDVANIAASLRFGRLPFWSHVAEARHTCAAARSDMLDLIAKTYHQGFNRRRALA